MNKKILSILVAIFTILLVNSHTTFAYNEWTEQQDSGRYYWTSIASSSDGQYLTATTGSHWDQELQQTVYGYIYTSNDYGVTWQEQQGAGRRNWSSVASDSTGQYLVTSDMGYYDSEQQVWVGGYIYTSNDYGVTWQEQQGSGKQGWINITSSYDGQYLTVINQDNDYIYTSDDYGITWTTNNNSSGQYPWRLVVSDSTGQYLAAINSNYDYIYTSDDYGVTWTTNNSSSGQYNWNSVASDSTGQYLVATNDNSTGYIYTSNDYGVTWQEVLLPNGFSSASNISASSDMTTMIAIFDDSYLWLSIDGGNNWTKQFNLQQGEWIATISSDGSHIAVVARNSHRYIYTYNPNFYDELPITIYESSDIEVIPGNPGTLGTATYDNISNIDNKYWVTDLSSGTNGSGDVQVYKIKTSGENNSFNITWVGHGDENEMTTELYVWNFNTEEWEQLDSDICPTDCNLSGNVSGGRYLDREDQIWVAAVANNYIAPIEIIDPTIAYDINNTISWQTTTEGDSEVVIDITPHATWQEFLDSMTSEHYYGSYGTSHYVNAYYGNGEPVYFMVRSTDGNSNIATSVMKGPYYSSCPFIFSYDGEKYNFITESSSAGILSLGTTLDNWQTNPFYKKTFYPNPFSAVVIPSDKLVAQNDGSLLYYDIRATTELNETNYYDQATLRVVDHSKNVDIYPDYRNVDDTIHTIKKDAPNPISVTDQDGNDVSRLIAHDDNVYWQSPKTTAPSYLQIKLADGDMTPQNLKLLIKKGKEGDFFNSMPHDALQYKNESGEFVNVPDAYNIFMVKRPGAPASSINVSNLNGVETKVIDLSGLQIKDNEIRLVTTNDKTQWDIDWLVVDTTPDETLSVTDLSPRNANLHFRGISDKELTSSNIGIKQPNYDKLTDAYITSPLSGYATSYGEVKDLLSSVDNKFVIMTQGDELALKYAVPEQSPETQRDFIFKSWDYHKPYIYGLGDTIDPLPFNEMTQYPYDTSKENYPYQENQSYLDEYNTRNINWTGLSTDIIPNKLHHSLNTDYIGIEENGNESVAFDWAKQIEGADGNSWSQISSITLDEQGNIYTTGYFEGTVDFDPSDGTYNLTSNNASSFISILSNDGSFIGAYQLRDGENGYSEARSITLDEQGNIYTTGYFNGTVDFDPSEGTYNLTSNNSSSFISILSSDGSFIGAYQLGDGENGGSGASSITLDEQGNIYTTGSFWGTIDFDLSEEGTHELTSSNYNNSSFISILSSDGSFIGAYKIGYGENGDSGASSITLDEQGNIYTTGYFWGTVDFDPSANTYNLTSDNNYSSFISILSSDGSFIGAYQLGDGENDESHSSSITLDEQGNIYTTGWFSGTVDFGNGYELTANQDGDGEAFIVKMDQNGNTLWAIQLKGEEGEYNWSGAYSTTLDNDNNIFTVGSFYGTVDFDPGDGVYELTSNIQNEGSVAFILKLNQEEEPEPEPETPFAGGTGTEEDPYQISTCQQLQDISYYDGQDYPYLSQGYYFILINNIDCGETTTWNPIESSTGTIYQGFDPIGNGNIGPFIGTFDGDGYIISDLYINRISNEMGTGLFGYTSDSIIEDTHIINQIVKGKSYVGGLVGVNESSSIYRSYVIGDIEGGQGATVQGYAVGGLVGYNDQSYISDSYTKGTVTGFGNLTKQISVYDGAVGGLVGYAYGNPPDSIINSYSTSTVKGIRNVGGLVGYDFYDDIRNSYAVGTVSGQKSVGGLVGGLSGDYQNLILNSGWYKSILNNRLKGIGSINGGYGANITYNEIDNTVFYSSNHGIYDQDGDSPWVFGGDPWYEYYNNYPDFVEDEQQPEPDPDQPPIVHHLGAGGGGGGDTKSLLLVNSPTSSIEGCQPGYLFSPINGEPCPTTTTIVGCQPGYVYSPVTGQLCSSSSSSTYYFTSLLKLGSTGNEVLELQKYLNAHGYDCGTPDGVFGSKTKAAVIALQIANGLTPDGVVGVRTREILNG